MWIRFLLLFCFVFGTSASCFGASVNWNASIVDAEHGAPDGYKVYYGSASDQLTTVWDNGGSTVFDIPDTWAVGTYYFSVRAYNASGESGWATTPEGQTWVSYVKADPPPILPPAPATDVRIVWEKIEEDNMASDDFTGSNDTALTTHDSNWSCVTGSNSGRLYNNGVSYGAWNEGSYRYTGSNGNVSEITVIAGGGEKVGPAVRMGSSTGGYMAHFSSLSGGNWTYLSLYKNGPWQDWSSGSWSNSVDHVIRIEASGTSPVTVDVYVDDVLVIDGWSDSSSPYSSGLSGIFLQGDGSNDYAFGDNWSDGDTGGGSSAVPKIMLLQDHFSGGVH